MANLVPKRLVWFSEHVTKSLLIQALQDIPGDPVPKAYDPDMEAEIPITGFAYDQEELIFYTDEN